MRVRRFCGFVLGGLSGRVLSKVSSDVCIGEGSQIMICFGGAVGQGVGCRPRCRLMCVWVRVRRF